MSELNIYNVLRTCGLSPTGTCALMGNMKAESGCISCRIQGDFSGNYEKSKIYTEQVDFGAISRSDFVNCGPNGGGYGLAQWTWPKRKDNLYAFAKGAGLSIGDETMQCNFAINELQIEYKELYSYLCKTDNLYEATEKICLKYEQPAVANVKERYSYAQQFFDQFAKNDTTIFQVIEEPVNKPQENSNSDTCMIEIRTLHKGDLGHDVFVAQCGLFDLGFDCEFLDGDFGKLTEKAVLAFQQHYKLNTTGVIGQAEWKLILNSK